MCIVLDSSSTWFIAWICEFEGFYFKLWNELEVSKQLLKYDYNLFWTVWHWGWGSVFQNICWPAQFFIAFREDFFIILGGLCGLVVGFICFIIWFLKNEAMLTSPWFYRRKLREPITSRCSFLKKQCCSRSVLNNQFKPLISKIWIM